MTKTARDTGRSIYRVFCLIKLCLDTNLACLVRTMVARFKSYKI